MKRLFAANDKFAIVFLFALFLIPHFILGQTNPPRHINFQGKLYQDNVPFTGTGNFQFIISNPAWIQTSNNVQVQDGLYTVVLGSGNNPMPGDMFANQESVEMTVSFNGTQIDIVTLYAPFEKDYTVPENIKDGIDWTEITNIPAIDNSTTNELQTLNLSGTTLSLSPNGGSVILPQGNIGVQGDLTVNGSFSVMDTTAFEMYYQQGFNTNFASSNAWQSFKASANGRLRKIRTTMAITGNNFVTVKIFDGTNITAFPLASGSVSITNNPSQMLDRYLDVTNVFNPAVELQAGHVYTFQIVAPVGGQVDVRYATTNPYPFGMCHIATDADMTFGIYMDNSAPASLSVASNGYLGVGVSNPTAALEVGGRIKDQTGFVMPVGSVLAYFGTTAPEGWLLCDGAAYSRLEYCDLFQVISTACGSGDGVNTFNVPDLRGRFVRGVDGVAGNDPDKDGRTAMNSGGNSGNNVGSVQGDQFRAHYHRTSTTQNNGAPPYLAQGGNLFGSDTGSPDRTTTEGGSETRPVNANANYIIKY